MMDCSMAVNIADQRQDKDTTRKEKERTFCAPYKLQIGDINRGSDSHQLRGNDLC